MENKNFDIFETTKDHDISSRVYWRDPHEWEEMIRQEEREKIFWEKHEARMRKQRAYQQRKDNFICSLPIRIMGLLMIAISLTYLLASIDRDCTFLLVTVPLSLIFIICPGYNNKRRK